MTKSTQYIPRHVTLGEIADLVPGYSEKESGDRGRGPLHILQARDFDASGAIRWNQLDRCEAKPGAERARLHPDDVLLMVRAADPRARHVATVPADVVAGATFTILRCRRDTVDARFLTWLLDTEGTRQLLRGELRGSAMPFLGVADLKHFSIPLPPLQQQLAIARVHGLRHRMTELSHRLDRAVGQLLESAAGLSAS